MVAIAIAVLVCLTLRSMWCDALPFVARMVALAERVYAVDEEDGEDGDEWQDAEPEPLPDDIESLAQAESEDWAKDAVRERARELFRSTNGDWDATRQILMAERQATIFGSTAEGRA
jgi:hypothetical protein